MSQSDKLKFILNSVYQMLIARSDVPSTWTLHELSVYFRHELVTGCSRRLSPSNFFYLKLLMTLKTPYI